MSRHLNVRLGSNFTDFLRELGIYEEVEAAAIKKIIAAMLCCRVTLQNDAGRGSCSTG